MPFVQGPFLIRASRARLHLVHLHDAFRCSLFSSFAFTFHRTDLKYPWLARYLALLTPPTASALAQTFLSKNLTRIRSTVLTACRHSRGPGQPLIQVCTSFPVPSSPYLCQHAPHTDASIEFHINAPPAVAVSDVDMRRVFTSVRLAHELSRRCLVGREAGLVIIPVRNCRREDEVLSQGMRTFPMW